MAKISNLPDFWDTYPIFEEVFHHADSLLVKIFNGLSRPGIVKVESFQFKTDSVTFKHDCHDSLISLRHIC